MADYSKPCLHVLLPFSDTEQTNIWLRRVVRDLNKTHNSLRSFLRDEIKIAVSLIALEGERSLLESSAPCKHQFIWTKSTLRESIQENIIFIPLWSDYFKNCTTMQTQALMVRVVNEIRLAKRVNTTGILIGLFCEENETFPVDPYLNALDVMKHFVFLKGPARDIRVEAFSKLILTGKKAQVT